LSRFVTSFLFQVTGRDPMVYLTVGALLLAIALLAALIPALRASRVDPIIALRS
jgi:putative ABC transport system permease protein